MHSYVSELHCELNTEVKNSLKSARHPEWVAVFTHTLKEQDIIFE